MLNTPLPLHQSPHRAQTVSLIDTGQTRVVVLTSLVDMENWAAAWQALDRQSTAELTYFQSYDWCNTWLKHHGAKVSPHVIIVLQGEDVVAIWPLMRQKLVVGLKILAMLGDPHTQYANILTRHGHLNAEAVAALRGELAATKGVDHLALNYVPQQSPLHLVFSPASEVAILRNEAAHFNLKQFRDSADYQARQSKNQRRMRKKSATLLSGLGDLHLLVLRPNAPQFSGMVAKCMALKKMWLQRTGRIGQNLIQSQHEEFLSNLSGDHPVGDGAILFVLMAGQKPVAFEYGLLQRQHYYSYLGSFAWGWRHASPGSLQIAMTIDWLIDNRIATFDLLGNPENYKQMWTDVIVPLTSYMHNFTILGAFYGTVWTRLARPKLKMIYKAMPASWRSNLNIVRLLNLSPVA